MRINNPLWKNGMLTFSLRLPCDDLTYAIRSQIHNNQSISDRVRSFDIRDVTVEVEGWLKVSIQAYSLKSEGSVRLD